MKKIILIAASVVLAAILIISGYKVGSILWEYRVGEDEYDDIESQYTTTKETESADDENTQPDTVPEDNSGHITEAVSNQGAPLSVNFDSLLQENGDVVGWIYSEGTPINYPIAQADDNEKYLRHTLTGKYNKAGTLFVDYRNTRGFVDINTLVYGHNLKNSEMFGTLLNYKEQSYYDEHKIMWLLTPDHTYRLKVFAGFTTDATGWPYKPYMLEDDLEDYLTRAYGASDFTSDVDRSTIERFLTLSTCSYAYDDARYVVLCALEEVE